MPGYHKRDIQKGVLGEVSKITEEYTEFIDANEQGSRIMELVELSDLVGAITFYVKNKYGMGITDLVSFSNITKRAFEDGTRK